MSKILEQSLIRELFDYKDGVLYRRISTSGSVKVGDVAGYPRKKDRRYSISINNTEYLRSRIIFTYFKGEIPSGYVIDHRDRDCTNDKIENLRCITQGDNLKNTEAKGYYLHSCGKYHSTIRTLGKVKSLGYFSTEKEANKVYLEAKKLYHKIEEVNEH